MHLRSLKTYPFQTLALMFALTTMFVSVVVNSVDAASNEPRLNKELLVEWAINVGGQYHQGADGIEYQAYAKERAGKIDSPIKGAQDDTVFKTYALGRNTVTHAITNGRYDVLFKFAEPDALGVGNRVFDVVVEGVVMIEKLDVALARDGNAHSALTRVVTDVAVDDGVLNIELISVVGEPILSALVVRKKTQHRQGWRKVWGDEFEYSGKPDPSKWSHDVWSAKKVNDEDQAYTSRLTNVRVGDGVLTIEAHREDYQGARYTSGRLHTAGKADMLYGRVEVSAKLPRGVGTWPAIWMLPSDPYRYASVCPLDQDWQGNPNCDAWPNSGEIDIMEHVGYDMNRVHGTVHNRAYYWVNGEQRKASVEAHRVNEHFHVYAMEWSPERIDVFYNDTLYFTYLNQGEGWQAWPYNHPFYLILNIAVGGGWGGAGGPTDVTAFPAIMQIDYVRVYQKNDVINSDPDSLPVQPSSTKPSIIESPSTISELPQ